MQLRGSSVSPTSDSAVQPPVSKTPCLASILQYRDVFLLLDVNILQRKGKSGLGPSLAFRRAPFVTEFLQVANALTVYSVPSTHVSVTFLLSL
jgi:hypothetical protein